MSIRRANGNECKASTSSAGTARTVRCRRRRPARSVIEAFGCGLPSSYLDAMIALPAQPAWINLEYLSAESWIEGCHGAGIASSAPAFATAFLLPGIHGGAAEVCCARRASFRAAMHSRPIPPRAPHSGARWASRRRKARSRSRCSAIRTDICRRCSMRGPTAIVPVWCIVPEGVAAGELDRWTGGAVPHAGQVLARGRLSLAGIPFLAQDVYDRLLWACDVNLVRGEDSFVRALWAARPLIWQPYPQADDAQLAKLDAFLERYGVGDAAGERGQLQRVSSGLERSGRGRRVGRSDVGCVCWRIAGDRPPCAAVDGRARDPAGPRVPAGQDGRRTGIILGFAGPA